MKDISNLHKTRIVDERKARTNFNGIKLSHENALTFPVIDNMINRGGDSILSKIIQEIRDSKLYLTAVCLVSMLSYSVYLFFDTKIVASLGDEDQLFEWLTAICLVAASILFFLNYVKTRNFFFLLLSAFLFIGAGEEISWGQRILNFDTPEVIARVNVQNEFTIHNLEIFHAYDFHGNKKQWLERLTEINFLFRIFIMLFGIVLPLSVYHFKIVNRIAGKIKIPVPPVSIGIFFLLNWLTMKILLSYILPAGRILQYYRVAPEAFEFLCSFILFVLSLYFFNKCRNNVLGMDLKQIYLVIPHRI